MDICKAVCFMVILCLTGIKAFSWKSCGDSTNPIKIVSLNGQIKKFPILQLDGVGKTATNLTSPIQLSLQVWKKLFWGWTLIPCIENFGSCTYEDLCTLSPYSSDNCPAQFTSNNLPCACPILEGRYSAKEFPLNLDLLPRWIEKGTYQLKINLLKDGKQLLCLLVWENL